MAKIDRNELMEALSALENFIHAEYHYVEALAVNNDKLQSNEKLISLMREIHKTRTEMMDELVKSLPNIGPLWCTLKHLLLSRMSLLETAEKCASAEDVEIYLRLADRIYHLIKDMLFEIEINDFKSCSRCEEDKDND